MTRHPSEHAGPHVRQHDVPDLCQGIECVQRRLAHAATVAIDAPAIAFSAAPAPPSKETE